MMMVVVVMVGRFVVQAGLATLLPKLFDLRQDAHAAVLPELTSKLFEEAAGY